MEWNKEKTLLLIQEFHQRPGLWNMTHEDYRKKETKRNLLEQIAAKFNNSLTASDIERKFHTLRTQYHREINRMYTNRGTQYKSKWFAFPHLQFLNDPSACRNTKDSRRRSAPTPAKILYVSSIKADNSNESSSVANTSTATIQKADTPDKEPPNEESARNFRKDLRELFEETVDSEDGKNDEEQESTTAIEYMQPELQINKSGVHTCYEEEHLVESTLPEPNEAAAIAEEEREEYQQQIEQPPIKVLKTNHFNVDIKRTQDYQEALVYQTFQTAPVPIPAPKRMLKDAETSASTSWISGRDEFSIFGEFIANELRFITDRQLLVSVKHKINTALFEASVAQLQKNGCG